MAPRTLVPRARSFLLGRSTTKIISARRTALAYDKLPGTIFGKSFAQWQTSQIREILHYYKRAFSASLPKARLLFYLRELEKETSAKDKDAIEEWLNDDHGNSLFVTFIKNTKESKAKRARQTDLKRQNTRTTVECMICVEDFESRCFPKSKITESCDHEPTVCKACLTKSIDSQIPDVDWNQFKCPQCRAVLPFDVVKKYASAEEFERYLPHFKSLYLKRFQWI